MLLSLRKNGQEESRLLNLRRLLSSRYFVGRKPISWDLSFLTCMSMQINIITPSCLEVRETIEGPFLQRRHAQRVHNSEALTDTFSRGTTKITSNEKKWS